MTVFPEKQLAAQAELDKVLERKRLPEVEDMQYLPSITALVYEVLRYATCAWRRLHCADFDQGGTLPLPLVRRHPSRATGFVVHPTLTPCRHSTSDHR